MLWKMDSFGRETQATREDIIREVAEMGLTVIDMKLHKGMTGKTKLLTPTSDSELIKECEKRGLTVLEWREDMPSEEERSQHRGQSAVVLLGDTPLFIEWVLYDDRPLGFRDWDGERWAWLPANEENQKTEQPWVRTDPRSELGRDGK